MENIKNKYASILKKLEENGWLYKPKKNDFIHKLPGGEVITFIKFENKLGLGGEESQNFFAVYYDTIRQHLKIVPEIRFVKRDTLLSLARFAPNFLREGSVISLGDYPEKDFFLCLSWDSYQICKGQITCDKLNRYHNMTNYIIPIQLN